MSDIYIYTPANSMSGGPESLHQLAHELNCNGYTCYTVYYGKNRQIPEKLKKYKVVEKTKIEDKVGNIIICPESATEKIMSIENAKKVIWWLSLDFYHLFDYKQKSDRWSKKTKIPAIFYQTLLELCNKKTFQFNNSTSDTYHMYNSEYVRRFLIQNNILENQMFYLCGPINDIYINNTVLIESKENTIAYNPKKGQEFTRKVIDSFKNSGIRFISIENMTHQDVFKTLEKSKIYMDFGEFPGPERLPREAVSLYCNIITGTDGASGNSVDVPIYQKYKFEKEEKNIDKIRERICEMINNYSEEISDFDCYREKVNNQRLEFTNNIIYNISKINS